MRFLAPENFDTANNKQGHEENWARKKNWKKQFLEASMVFSSLLWVWFFGIGNHYDEQQGLEKFKHCF